MTHWQEKISAGIGVLRTQRENMTGAAREGLDLSASLAGKAAGMQFSAITDTLDAGVAQLKLLGRLRRPALYLEGQVAEVTSALHAFGERASDCGELLGDGSAGLASVLETTAGGAERAL